MSIIILSISEKSGHYHAALAIENGFKEYTTEVIVRNQNFFDFIGRPIMEKMVNRTYLSLLKKTPELWDYLYDNPKVYDKTRKLRRYINKKSSKRYAEILHKIQPDAIVCTQAFPCGVTADLKRRQHWNIPLIGIITDFIANAYWLAPEVDLYCVPAEGTKQDLVKRGIPDSKIKVLGIPIQPQYEKKYTLEQLSAIKSKMNLEPRLPILLIMGGSQGFGPLVGLIQKLNDSALPCQVIVVTGINRDLRRKLLKLKNKIQLPFQLFGYVNNVEELMSISNLLITKPGGITSTEALVKNLPMIILHPLPGQEEKNSQYLVNSGAALRADSVSATIQIVRDLFNHPEELNQLKENMHKLVIHDSAQNIVNSVMKLVQKS